MRKGEFEGLKEEISKDPAREPDYGPNKIHPTAGATAVGARFFLIAFNINLATDDIEVAKKIAKGVFVILAVDTATSKQWDLR